jgi:hypothetical protein
MFLFEVSGLLDGGGRGATMNDDVFTILLKFGLDYNLYLLGTNKTTVNLSKHNNLALSKRRQ